MYQNTSLWKKTLGINDSNHSDKIEELRQTFLKFRENSSFLVNRIASALPGLTQHDISHLDSLWDTASLIAGDQFPLNPLEGFILGGAILIHDSALCFEAFEGGKEELRNTNQWKDAYAELLDNADEPEEKIQEQADFIALRELHAIQAEKLLEISWKDPDTGQELYLLENYTLRKHFGKLIGQIASSHHWEIESLELRLPAQQNTLPNYPREWRIDPVKIACILRCADAAHINQLRAPDFLHALLKRNGVSYAHWKAQNKLAMIDIDQSDKNQETLLITSTTDFLEKDADAWYVVNDAISLINKEIESSNTTLKNRNPSLDFKIKKVAGVDSLEELSKYIKVKGWKPCSAKVHVGNIERLIQNLGGEMLYGRGTDLKGVAIRELIQNSRDSINARSYYDKIFEGKISIKLEEINQDFFLTIEDNGIGMSERVLTGPLLDFGTSFWTSNLIKSEFPGLRSSKFKAVGRFGIGFYSIFMIAEEVQVSSKNWNQGVNEIHQLKFNNGFSLRPIIKKGNTEDFHPSISTRIQLKLKKDVIPMDRMIEIKQNRVGAQNFMIPFSLYISAICSGLDTDVYYSSDKKDESRIHQNLKSQNFNKKQWLKDISFTDYHSKDYNLNFIDTNIDRMKFIVEDDNILGLAAINTSLENQNKFLGVNTVGGLVHPVNSRNGSNFFGFIDHLPKSAKREVDEFSGRPETLKNWAFEQLKDLKKSKLNPIEAFCAASSLCHFKTDPSDIAQILATLDNAHHFFNFDQLATLSQTKGIAFITNIHNPDHVDVHHKITNLPGYILIRPLIGGHFLSLKRDQNDKPENNYSILDCLYGKILSFGLKPKFSRIENIGKDRFDSPLSALILNSSK